jgi:Tfp pilus assembly protein PilF
MLGLASWKTGDSKQAESAFEEALRIDPKHVKSLMNLSRVLIEQKRFDAAIDKLTKAGELDPSSADVHRLLGRSYAAQGKFDHAMDAYRTAIAMDDKDVWSMNNLGLVLIQTGRFDEAVLPLARAVELRKDVAIFQNNLGMALENTGRFTAAAEAYKATLAADPNYAKAQLNLTRVQAVKVSSEEPFDLAATAKLFVESMRVPADETVVVR